MSDTKAGVIVPINRDSRTLEQRRRDFVTNLQRDYGDPDRWALTTPSVFNRDWFQEVNNWIANAHRQFNEDISRMHHDLFSLVPSYDWDPFRSDGFGHAQSVLARMDREMQMLRDQMFSNLHDLTSRTDGLLDFLNNAYEPGEDGRLHFKVRFDLRGYSPENIKVTTGPRQLTVQAQRSEQTSNSSSRSMFCRSIYLPEAIEDDKLQCFLSDDGVLVVDAPVKEADYQSVTFNRGRQLAIKPKSANNQANAALPSTERHSRSLRVQNKPGLTVQNEAGGIRKIHVEVPMETGFTADQIRVRVEHKELVVTGRQEVYEGTTKGTYTKEFRRSYPLPEEVDPISIHSELQGGTLVIEAPLLR
ncbi:Major egg antigen [Fasciola hepatica]|uniref:Major egg antigen n=1 Tax=Fasciola hepatica TaxID=6192 RepID=A0A4E0S249_FASHE|nr:Major egg antigen [Fasciola hepatica]